MAVPVHRLDELLDAFRCNSAEKAAFFEEDGRTFTASDFDLLVAQTAAWLTEHGIRPGDRVAVWLVNRIEWLALLFALARIGGILVAVNTRYRTAELRHILVSSGARLLILQPGFRRIDFTSVLAGLDPTHLPELEAVAVLGAPGDHTGHILDRPTVAFAPKAVQVSAVEPHTASDPNAPLIFFTTSGTTKAPKLVMHPQRTLALHALRCAAVYGFDQPGSTFLTALPLCGVFGLNTTLAAVAGAAPVHIASVFDAPDAAARIERHRVTHLFGSDEMFRRLMELGTEKLASARVCGFASFTPGLNNLMKSGMERGLPLVGVYGSSEVNSIFSIQPLGLPFEERLKAGGRPASGAEAEIRVRDPHTGKLLAPFETGSLEIRAPTNFMGYYRNDAATREAVDEEGFFRTGDIGYVRDDGTFVYLARGGDAMRLSGFLVDPAEIEDVLRTIDGVADAQVVGIERDGQTRPAAFIIPGPSFDETKVLEAAAQMLAAFKVPVRAFPIEAFPITEGANGVKVQRTKLREMAIERFPAGEKRS